MGMVTYLAYDENYIVIVESQEVTETKMSPICCVTLAKSLTFLGFNYKMRKVIFSLTTLCRLRDFNGT